ncbi:MAG: hypothetical protein WD467_02915 [Candidatus Saccharimonadales bacterium]
MNVDFLIAAAVIGISALALHFKSHVKFVAMGVFIGLALLQIVSLEGRFESELVESAVAAVLLVVPALILGVNHSVDKRKKGSVVWKIVFILVFTLFFLSSVVQVLPPETQQAIMDRSIIGWQILDNYVWFTFAAAILILIDSIQHRSYAEKAKKRKSKLKSSR